MAGLTRGDHGIAVCLRAWYSTAEMLKLGRPAGCPFHPCASAGPWMQRGQTSGNGADSRWPKNLSQGPPLTSEVKRVLAGNLFGAGSGVSFDHAVERAVH